MKNIIIKAYLVLFFLAISPITFAQGPGDENPIGNLKKDDDDATPPGVPVDDWIIPFVLLSTAVGYYAYRKKVSNNTL